MVNNTSTNTHHVLLCITEIYYRACEILTDAVRFNLVIGAYRDASKLIQRLKDKQGTSENFILPEHLTKDFEDSLALGTKAVQSQYDHDVRRFGETYARGDATAREEMKDILIALQKAVITHLREVYMDEASLDLHSLKETSDDSRVNATVCLGQLYQRMSTATAAMKQISNSKPYADERDKGAVPDSLAYSSSRSTHSSLGAGGGPFDNQSTTSYTTYSSRTAVVHDRKPSGGAMPPQRRISLNSALSYSSEREQPKSVTPGEDDIPALPLAMQRQSSQASAENNTSSSARTVQHIGALGLSTTARNALTPAPPPYKPDRSPSVQVSAEKGQNFPPESSFYQPRTADIRNRPPQSPPQRQGSLESYGDRNESSHPLQPRSVDVHELDDGLPSQIPSREERTTTHPAQQSRSQIHNQSQIHAVPVNPNYSTLEYVVDLETRSRPPASLATSQQYQGNQSQLGQAWPPQMQQGYYQQAMIHGQQWQSQPVAREQPGGTVPPSADNPVDPTLQRRVPTMQSTRPPSIRSSSSTGSKFSPFTLRRVLPPGIAEAIHKRAPLPSEGQPRYVRPKEPESGEQPVPPTSPTSPNGQHVHNWPSGGSTTSVPNRPPREVGMRAPSSPQMQVPRSELNIPNESNLAGFCKGAVRTQLGGRKKGFSLEHKRGGKGQGYFFRCTKCSFQGPASISTSLPSGGRAAIKREKTFDTQVRVSEGGIKYRWAFLAKSHVVGQAASSDGHNSNDIFGCYFCCAEGTAKGWVDETDTLTAQLATLGTFGDKKNRSNSKPNVTPRFVGLRAFLAHLETHRTASWTPGIIVANEMNCIVGRAANDCEDFDLNLPPLS
ncbi:hypothetical protein A1O1_02746 [Capronia coronata CBS 617.96]|uniref:Uncharacterized protein n=1 Tax=Capronia coronata CBS 617.96 TaxID=1182541 RepID=W9YN85_9EURO|nr:uncharacterized protein A1O1_02746 [Capronia coronata CBS 617.96]EXJ94352.1 hypothetical protein A1O1_02746 [Capronia coronata CBS 617.96]